MKKTKVKGTIDRFLETLSPEARRKHEEGYKELLISEMIIAAMENDDVSVRDLAKKAGISPTTVQNLRSGISNSGVKSLFKVFKTLGYSIFAEKGEERLPLMEADEKSAVDQTNKIRYGTLAEEPGGRVAPRIARNK